MQDENSIPYGYCQCNCGGKTTIAPWDDLALGYVKGEPRRFIVGHYGRMQTRRPLPDKPCECGCDEIVPGRGSNGRPRRFVNGHGSRKTGLRYTVEDRGHDTPCWIWNATTPGTYGSVCHDGRNIRAHVHLYVQKHGPVPRGLEIDHLCRVRECVNPDHLEAVTRRENVYRGNATKLSDAQVAEIRLAIGIPLRELAASYGISRNYASRVRCGRVRA